MSRIAGIDERCGERGFTMVEAIVVLVLLGVLAAGVMPLIGNMRTSQARSAASAQAEAEAKVAARALEADVRGAQGSRSLRDKPDLSTIHTGASANPAEQSTATALTAGGASTAASAKLVDIVEAGPTQLTVNADVLDVAGREQVMWVLVENHDICGDRDKNGDNWCILRRIFQEPS